MFVVCVTRPSPCARLPHHHVGGSHITPLRILLNVMAGTRCRVDGDEDDGGTLAGVKKLNRMVEVVRQACHGVLTQWRLGLVSRAVERCIRHKCWKLVVGILRRGVACRVVPA
jgi:hypothetical protein